MKITDAYATSQFARAWPTGDFVDAGEPGSAFAWSKRIPRIEPGEEMSFAYAVVAVDSGDVRLPATNVLVNGSTVAFSNGLVIASHFCGDGRCQPDEGSASCVTDCPPPDDADRDGVPRPDDNCPAAGNPAQLDTNGDGIGDACDPDLDGDGLGGVTSFGASFVGPACNS